MAPSTNPRPPTKPAAPHRDRKRVVPIPPPFDEVVARFNAGEFRACVEPLEILFFADRNTFYQGLLHLVVALLQTRRGMVRGPRLRFASASGLLAPYAPWHRGVDVGGLLDLIRACLERLPEGVVELGAAEVEALGLPLPRLEITSRPPGGAGRRGESPGARPGLNATSPRCCSAGKTQQPAEGLEASRSRPPGSKVAAKGDRMSQSEKIRCAVIGAGGFAEVCHVPGLQSHPRAEVVLLCGRNEERRRRMAERLGVPETAADYHEVIARPDIDAVTVTTPNVSHCPIALAALEAGKHVFCEKPLAMNASEADVMARRARECGLINHVAFTFRYTHGVARLRELLREGAIGQPFFVRMVGEGWGDLRPEARVAWRHQAALAGAGMLADMGSHYFDLVNWIGGPIAEVCGMLHTVERRRPDGAGQPVRVDTDDLAYIWLRTSAGVQGEFRSSRITPGHGDNGYMEVVGEQGALMAFLSRGNRDELRLLHPGGPAEEVALPPESRSGETYALGRMMRGFVDAILSGRSDSDLDPTFEAGLAAQRAQDAVLRSTVDRCWCSL